MRFKPEEIDIALAEFIANAALRVVPGAGYNEDILVYTKEDKQNGQVQGASDRHPGDV